LTASQRELEYSPSSRLPDRDLGPFLERYRSLSDAARRSIPPVTIRYGSGSSNTIDLALPGRPSLDTAATPIHVFVHGGYWQELSKLDSYFLAPACVDRGVALAAVDYTLAPTATIDRIVSECRSAIRTLRSVAADHGLDPSTMIVSGSSAGAHLATMATLGLAPSERPAGLILVSGIYLLDPLIDTSINDAIDLDRAAADRLSPLSHDLRGLPPAVVAHGDDETDEFKRQSRAMVDALTGADVPVTEVQVADRNHFDVVFDIVPALTEVLAALT
jgi:arylformamidase